MAAALEHAPSGDCVAWGIPFEIGGVVAIADQAVSVELDSRDEPPQEELRALQCCPLKAGGFHIQRTDAQVARSRFLAKITELWYTMTCKTEY